MRITFLGAAGEVTGSCYLIETGRARVLIDLGLHQGERDADEHNQRMPAMPPDGPAIEAIVATHAHIDHTGRLPLIVRRGYAGPIHATRSTCKMAELLLEDSAELQEQDALRDTRKRAQRGLPPVEPLYTLADAKRVLPLLKGHPYKQWADVAKGVRVRFWEAGHMLGSASVDIEATDDAGLTRRLIFSGDLGPRGVPIMRDFEPPPVSGTDPAPALVVMESTYGDREHRPLDATMTELAQILHDAAWAKEKVLIPTFSVGRAQLLLYAINELMDSGRVPRFEVYLDSPMASEATRAYRDYVHELDDQTRAKLRKKDDPFGCDFVRVVETGEQSRQLNDRRGAMVILAGSGMCNGGRIVHHLRHNLYKRDVRVIIAGYQARGTLGRCLVEGDQEVRIFGEQIPVRARIHTLGGFSAHAGQNDLVRWASTYLAPPLPAARAPIFALTHGEDAPRRTLAARLQREFGVEPLLPVYQSSVTI